MPAYPRRDIVAHDEVGVYHCIARCVRRAFLCGVDPLSGVDHEHRKEWIRERLQQLASVFAIDVCGYAVMSNHLHVVLRGRPDLVQDWSDEEIAIRWKRLYPPRDPATGTPVEPAECDLAMIVSDCARVSRPIADTHFSSPIADTKADCRHPLFESDRRHQGRLQTPTFRVRSPTPSGVSTGDSIANDRCLALTLWLLPSKVWSAAVLLATRSQMMGVWLSPVRHE